MKYTYEQLLNEDPDMSLYSLNARLEANSSKEYQSRAKLKAKILLKFLLDNHLIKEPQYFHFNNEVIDYLKITIKDVTADGFELFRHYVNNWYKAHDRGTAIEKITILQKGLAKIRENKSTN